MTDKCDRHIQNSPGVLKVDCPYCRIEQLQERLDAVAALYVKAPQYQKRYGPNDMRPPDHTVYVEFSRDEFRAALEQKD